MGLFDRFKKNKEYESFEKDALFEHILKVFFEFRDKYPDKVFSLHILPSKRVSGYVAFDILCVFSGNVNWLDSPEARELLEYFTAEEDNGGFQTLLHVYNSYKESSDAAYVDKAIKGYVRNFMNDNPDRRFDLTSTGAKINFI